MHQIYITQTKFPTNGLKTLFSAFLCISFFVCSVCLAEDRHEDHEALRALLKQSVTALNSGNIEALRAFMIPEVLVTTAEQHRSHNFDEFKKYYDGLFNGPDAKLASISFQPSADDLTKFIDNNVGVVTGTSNDTYKFKDGDSRAMISRWTATLLNDGGQWKVASFHFGVNFMDNPVLDAVKAFMIKLGIGCILGGLLIGFLAAKLCFRKCSKN